VKKAISTLTKEIPKHQGTLFFRANSLKIKKILIKTNKYFESYVS